MPKTAAAAKKAPLDDLVELDATTIARREQLRFSVGRFRIEPESDPKRGAFVSTESSGRTQTLSNISAGEAKQIIDALTQLFGF